MQISVFYPERVYPGLLPVCESDVPGDPGEHDTSGGLWMQMESYRAAGDGAVTRPCWCELRGRLQIFHGKPLVTRVADTAAPCSGGESYRSGATPCHEASCETVIEQD